MAINFQAPDDLDKLHRGGSVGLGDELRKASELRKRGFQCLAASASLAKRIDVIDAAFAEIIATIEKLWKNRTSVQRDARGNSAMLAANARQKLN